MNVTFTLQQDNGVEGFIDIFEVKSPRDVGRYDFQVSSSLSSYVHLRQISRKFFSIKEDLNVIIHSQNITHFQFLDDSDNIIDIIDLTRMGESGYTFRASATEVSLRYFLIIIIPEEVTRYE